MQPPLCIQVEGDSLESRRISVSDQMVREKFGEIVSIILFGLECILFENILLYLSFLSLGLSEYSQESGCWVRKLVHICSIHPLNVTRQMGQFFGHSGHQFPYHAGMNYYHKTSI